jgi:hypothetical protein
MTDERPGERIRILLKCVARDGAWGAADFTNGEAGAIDARLALEKSGQMGQAETECLLFVTLSHPAERYAVEGRERRGTNQLASARITEAQRAEMHGIMA